MAGLVADAGRTGQFTGLDDVKPVLAPDGRTATIDVPMTGDFSRTGAGVAHHAARPAGAVAAAAALPGTQVLVTGPTGRLGGLRGVDARRTCRGSWRSSWPDLRGAGVRLPVGRRRGHRGGAQPAVGRCGVRAAGAGLPARVRPAAARLPVDSGVVIDWLPLFLFVVLFGLSMDYHVFVVSRIREAHDSGLPTRVAVARGVTSSAGVVTSAAAVMVGVFSIFGTLSLLEFKQLGVGLAVAVLIDATVVRAVLLPSAMTLLGRRNWWMPAALERRLPAAH